MPVAARTSGCIAVRLAQDFHATLVGLLAIGHADPSSIRYLVDGDRYLDSYREWHKHIGEVARHAFFGATDELLFPTEWHAPEGAAARQRGRAGPHGRPACTGAAQSC
ncbi:hypothetical protein ACTMU2_41680 [Cupriavidus basilensis]